eukprot:m.1150955 g.1150955  ORF g.1150955 m.1150955 type:complete len:94 (-) comp24479_c0_seq5:643-924(-)
MHNCHRLHMHNSRRRCMNNSRRRCMHFEAKRCRPGRTVAAHPFYIPHCTVSTHSNTFGTDGGVLPSFAPMEMAFTPALDKMGTSALVIPGTSR